MIISDVQSFFVEPGGALYVRRYTPIGDGRMECLFAQSQQLVVATAPNGLYQLSIGPLQAIFAAGTESESEKQ